MEFKRIDGNLEKAFKRGCIIEVESSFGWLLILVGMVELDYQENIWCMDYW